MNREKPDFDLLYDEYGQRVYRLCFRLTGRVSDAEDLTQDTFLAVMNGWSSYRGDAPVQTWIFRIAVKKVHSHIRRRIVQRLFVPTNPPKRDADARLDLLQALDNLPLKYREAFLLVKLEGMTLREAADVLGLPEGTLKTRVYEAIRQLRGQLCDSYDSVRELSHEV